MACWGFSLFVRLVSEGVARKRKRLATRYSKRATWIAVVLMVLCAAVSVLCGYVAIELYDDFNRGTNPWVNGATVIGWVITAFGAFLLIWWMIGDRARGRLRCPKCWYDMSAAVDGEAGLQCPECGKTAKDEAKFGKARRPRWMVVMAVVLMGSGWYGVTVGPRVAETEEWLAAVPTWVLMMGWEVLPEEWIYWDSGSIGSEYESRLQRRVRGNFDVQWTYPFQVDMFRKHVLYDFGNTIDSRWSPRRRAILEAAVDSVGPSNGAFFVQSPDENDWQRYDHDQISDLFHAYTTDLFEMLESPEESSEYNTTLNTLVRQSSWGGLRTGTSNPQVVYEHCFYLTKPHIESVDPEDYEYDDSIIVQEFSVYQDRINSESFLRNLSSESPARMHLACIILFSSRQEIEHLDEIFRNTEGPRLEQLIRYTYYIANSTEDRYNQSSLNLILKKCDDWIRSGDHGKKFIGYSLLRGIQRNDGLNAETENPYYLSAYTTAMELGVHDTTPPLPNWGQSPKITTQHLLLHHDTTHELSFAMIRDALNTSPKDALHFEGIVDLTKPDTADLWLRFFSDIQQASDPLVRDWFEYNTPPRYAARDKDLWDTVAARYLNDQVRDDLIKWLPED